MNQEAIIKLNEAIELVQQLYNDYCESYTGKYGAYDDVLRELESRKFDNIQSLMKDIEDLHRKNIMADYCLIDDEKRLIESFKNALNYKEHNKQL